MASPFTPATIPSSDWNGGTVTGDIELFKDAPSFIVESSSPLASLFSVGESGVSMASAAGAQLTVNSTNLKYEADNGDDILIAHASGQVELDPQNGQVDAIHGFLRLASNAAPADADLFNGAFGIWLDTGTSKLKIKAKIGGSFVTADIATLT